MLQGRRLFQQGVGLGGAPLRGAVGPEGAEVSGRSAACASCHGVSGTGAAAGGVVAPDITAGALFQARGGEGETARPAYDARTLGEALRSGVSPTGRSLGVAMPRFTLGEADLSALTAYLHQLGEAEAPDAVRVGVALPLSGERAEVGEDVRQVLHALFAERNVRGGVLGRRLELVVEDDARPEATVRLLESGVLALLEMSAWAPPEGALRTALEGVPVVAPLGTLEEGSEAPVFLLYPGPELQARVVVQHLASEGASARGAWVVLAARSPEGQRWREGAREEAARLRHPPPVEQGFLPGELEPAAAVALLQSVQPTGALFLGTRRDLLVLLAAREAVGDRTPLFAPMELASEAEGEVLPTGMEHVTFVCPMWVGGTLEDKGQEFLTFLARHRLQPRHLAAQMSAYASGRVLEEALAHAGDAVTREGLAAALAGIGELETGVAPPLTFGTSRHVGIQGAFLVRWSLGAGRLEVVAPWREVGP